MAKFTPILELVDDLCLRSGDIAKRNKGLFLSVSKDVWNDLNEDVLKLAERVKIPVRCEYPINKRTNSIDLPVNALRVCSVNVIDEFGNYIPVYRNDKISDDIVEVGETQNCSCGCGNKLCNTIKGYEAVTSIKSDFLPDGTPISFTCVDRKSVDENGFFVSETQYPQRVYMSGVWTNTILFTETTKLCKVDVDENGCVLDTPNNIDSICNSCGVNFDSPIPYGGTADTPPCGSNSNEWVYYCDNKMDWFGVQCGSFPYGFKKGYNNIYNISELGNRLIFPHDFGWDKVMVRFYSDIDLQDLQIPYVARETFMTGIQYFASSHNDMKQQLNAMYGQKYSRQKKGLFLNLNKYRIAELKQILTPPIYIPSYNNRNMGIYGEFYGD